ncbi:hypothetical protein HII36_06240 [Nonomuraea sp. NN258]|uniref:hypothetical protein n=1 Tax=Nonomuraea antri TaxID=2730852 RepID=UPI0015689375|nr:hypothetical protein [Nonomuraea antri]NRQ31440.1 hypothetical protein [Nonomuraea antri]
MAFSGGREPNDKGRHRRGRWWRRGSYLFSRRGEAPPDADRSFWSDARRRQPESPRPPENPAREQDDRRRRWPGADSPGLPEQALFAHLDAPREWRERLPAAVLDRPQYTWYDFELDDSPPRAQPDRPDAPSRGDGLRHCGRLESILHRQWDARYGPPSPDAVRAVESLARLPDRLKELLATGLEGIYVGPGGVPDLDDMGYLRGAPLPSGRATWDICAGAYGERKIVVGDRPSPTPDVMMHEVGHAIDDIDAGPGDWVSDSPAFVRLYEQVRPLLMSTFHRQAGGLGRKEFFADAFAAIASRQRPALVDMLGGDTRMALNVMLFFNRRYGI